MNKWRRGVLVLAATLYAGAAAAQPALITPSVPFIGITPCRVVDTRDATKPQGYGPPALTDVPREFTLTGACGVPAGAQAVSLNVTAVNARGSGYILLYPGGGAQPIVSTLNYGPATIANAAVVPLGVNGGVTAAAAVSDTDFLMDINGYFAPSALDVSNTFLGLGAGNPGMTGLYNTAIGFNAFNGNFTGLYNTAAGYFALSINTEGSNNTAVGTSALRLNTTGAKNTAVGAGALSANVTGEDNVAIGAGALGSLVDGVFNTAIGGYALANSTGSNNLALGYEAGFDLGSGNSNMYLGHRGVASESATIRIGDPAVHTRFFLAGVYGKTTGMPDAVPFFIDSTGQLGTQLSSVRYKEDVRDMKDPSEALRKLRPVSFRYRGGADPDRHYGLIAEEVDEVYPELVVHGADGLPEAVQYHELPALLLRELQQQLAEGERLEQEAAAQEEILARQGEEARRQEAQIEELRERVRRAAAERGR